MISEMFDVPILVAKMDARRFYGIGLPDDVRPGEVELLAGEMPAAGAPMMLAAVCAEQAAATDAAERKAGRTGAAFWEQMTFDRALRDGRALAFMVPGRVQVISIPECIQ